MVEMTGLSTCYNTVRLPITEIRSLALLCSGTAAFTLFMLMLGIHWTNFLYGTAGFYLQGRILRGSDTGDTAIQYRVRYIVLFINIGRQSCLTYVCRCRFWITEAH
jgi:hypothetical protein